MGFEGDRRLYQKDFSQYRWAERHGLIPEFLDFRFQEIDPIVALKSIRRLLTNTKDTAKTFTVSQLHDAIPEFDNPQHFAKKLPFLASVHRMWRPPCRGERGDSHAYLNPNYVSIDDLPRDYYITTQDDRFEMIDRHLRHGLHSMPEIALMFGVKYQSFRRFVTRHDINWQQRRKEARKRLAQTWVTLDEWGHDREAIAEAFDMKKATVHSTISTHVPDSFEPPVRPTEHGADIRSGDFNNPRQIPEHARNDSPTTHVAD